MTKISRVLIAITIVACAWSLNAEPLPMRAYIPFAFLAGNQALPAGEYTIQVDEHNRLLMSSPEMARVTSVPISSSVDQPESKAATGRLEFAKYGETYVLRNVWHPDSKHGSQLVVSKRARELARHSGAAEVVIGLQ